MSTRWIERRFERLIWKFRLICIVPVVLSLLGSVGCFVIGAIEVFSFSDDHAPAVQHQERCYQNNRPDGGWG